jgi:citrate synthase
MTESQAGAFKPKKSVALSGVTAGNTALCTVGKTGNDLHYRGYDILDIATESEFEEIAYLLVHEKLPNRAELAAYKTKLKSLRVPPAPVLTVLEQLPAASHRWMYCERGYRRSAVACPKRPIIRSQAHGNSPTAYWPAWARCSATGITSR